MRKSTFKTVRLAATLASTSAIAMIGVGVLVPSVAQASTCSSTSISVCATTPSHQYFLPDLVIGNVQWGNDGSATYEVQNAGPTDAGESWASVTRTGAVAQTDYIPPLVAGGSYQVYVRDGFNYNDCANADIYNQVHESDKTNNTLCPLGFLG